MSPLSESSPSADSGSLPYPACKLPLALAIVDREGQCLNANDAFLRLFSINTDARPSSRETTPLVQLVYSSTSLSDVDNDRFNAELSELLRRSKNNESHETSASIRIKTRRLKLYATDATDGTYWLTVIDQTDDRVSEQELTATNRLLKQREARLLDLALTDQLTQLPNRSGYEIKLAEVLANARTDESSFALFFIDLDGFKHINDSFGHTSGDELLVEIARRLDNASRKSDTVVRLGGDEFVVIADPISDRNSIMNLAERLLKECREPVWLQNRSIRVSASIGVAIYPADVRLSDDNDQIERLEQCADLAMYRAKGNGRNTVSLFEPGMLTEAIENLNTTQALRVAIERNEFSIDLQPVYDIVEHKIVGLEALVRWDHPSRGRLLPGDFIAIAEKSNLIRDIDLLVFENVVKKVASLSDNWPTGLYATLAYLKSLSFSALKIDRHFVQDMGKDSNSAALIKAIINMAQALDLDVIAKSVETEKQLAELRTLGCRYAQGHLLARPLDAESAVTMALSAVVDT